MEWALPGWNEAENSGQGWPAVCSGGAHVGTA